MNKDKTTDNNKLVQWVEDGCPPIDLNKYPSLVVKLASENKRLKEVNKLLVDALKDLIKADDVGMGKKAYTLRIDLAKASLKEANLIK